MAEEESGVTLENDQTNPCFGCGPGNPRGLRLSFRRMGDRVETSLLADVTMEGWPRRLHSGILSTAKLTICTRCDVFLHLGSLLPSSPFEFTEGLEDALAARELPHSPHLQSIPLTDEDPERVLQVLVASIHQLHDDRMFRVGDREYAASPPDPDEMADRVLRSWSDCRSDVHMEERERVVHRAVGPFRTGISQIFRADLKAPPTERFRQPWCILLAVIDDHVDIRRRPGNAEGRDGEGSNENMLHSRSPEGFLRGANHADERAPLRRHLGGSKSTQSGPRSFR